MVPLAILCSLKVRARNPARHINSASCSSRRRNRSGTTSACGRVSIARSRTLDRSGDASERKLPAEPAPPGARPGRTMVHRAPQWRRRTWRHLPGDGQRLRGARRARVRPRSSVSRADAHRAPAICSSAGPRCDLVPALCLAGVGYGAGHARDCRKSADGAPSRAGCPTRIEWLVTRQLPDAAPGDWRAVRPGVRGGGWPFQFANAHYPGSR